MLPEVSVIYSPGCLAPNVDGRAAVLTSITATGLSGQCGYSQIGEISIALCYIISAPHKAGHQPGCRLREDEFCHKTEPAGCWGISHYSTYVVQPLCLGFQPHAEDLAVWFSLKEVKLLREKLSTPTLIWNGDAAWCHGVI